MEAAAIGVRELTVLGEFRPFGLVSEELEGKSEGEKYDYFLFDPEVTLAREDDDILVSDHESFSGEHEIFICGSRLVWSSGTRVHKRLSSPSPILMVFLATDDDGEPVSFILVEQRVLLSVRLHIDEESDDPFLEVNPHLSWTIPAIDAAPVIATRPRCILPNDMEKSRALHSKQSFDMQSNFYDLRIVSIVDAVQGRFNVVSDSGKVYVSLYTNIILTWQQVHCGHFGLNDSQFLLSLKVAIAYNEAVTSGRITGTKEEGIIQPTFVESLKKRVEDILASSESLKVNLYNYLHLGQWPKDEDRTGALILSWYLQWYSIPHHQAVKLALEKIKNMNVMGYCVPLLHLLLPRTHPWNQ